MMSEADDAFLHVHLLNLDHVQPKSRSQDYVITSRSAIWLQNLNCARTWANSKDAKKMSVPRVLAKGHCMPEVGSKRKAGQTLCSMCGMQHSGHFLCCLLLQWSLQVLMRSLFGSNLALIQVPGNHDKRSPFCFNFELLMGTTMLVCCLPVKCRGLAPDVVDSFGKCQLCLHQLHSLLATKWQHSGCCFWDIQTVISNKWPQRVL